MDRSAKGIRIAGALLLFVNLAVFFLPMTKIVHTNYGTKEFSAFQYLQNVIHPDSANPHARSIVSSRNTCFNIVVSIRNKTCTRTAAAHARSSPFFTSGV